MFISPFDDNFAFVLLTAKDAIEESVLPEERALLNNVVVEKRKKEFLLGRMAARVGLRKLGVVEDFPILKGKFGEPLWPEGYTGSISHSDQTAVAVVAPTNVIRSVGIDLQMTDNKLRYDISRHICTEKEKKWLETLSSEREQMLLAIFSVKESIYKALCPLCKQYFGFQDVELSFDPERKSFSGILLKELSSDYNIGYELETNARWEGKWIFTYCVIKRF